MRFTAPSGEVYAWDDSKGAPTQADVDQLVAFDAQKHPRPTQPSISTQDYGGGGTSPPASGDVPWYRPDIDAPGPSVGEGLVAGLPRMATSPAPPSDADVFRSMLSAAGLPKKKVPPPSTNAEALDQAMGVKSRYVPSIARQRPDVEANISGLPFTKEELQKALGAGQTYVLGKDGSKIATNKATSMWQGTGAALPSIDSNLLDNPEFDRSLYGKLPAMDDRLGSRGLIGHGEAQYSPGGQFAPGSASAAHAQQEIEAAPQLANYKTALGTGLEVANFASYFIPVFGEARFALETANSLAKGDPAGLVGLIPVGVGKLVEHLGGFKALSELWRANPDRVNAAMAGLPLEERKAVTAWAEANSSAGAPPRQTVLPKVLDTNDGALGSARSGSGNARVAPTGSGDVPTVPEPTEVGAPKAPTIEDQIAEVQARRAARSKPLPRGKQSGAANIGWEDISDAIELGKLYVQKGARNFGDWSSKMVGQFGDGIKPHLQDLFDSVNNALGGGLSKLSRVSPDAAMMARRMAGSDSEGALSFALGRNAVDMAAGEPGFHDTKLLPALVQSRLTGLKGRLGDMTTAVRGMGKKAFAAGYDSDYKFAAERLGAASQVETLLQSGKVADAKNLLADALQGGSEVKNDVLTPAQLKAIQDHPKFGDALQAYKDTTERALAGSHGLNEGVFSDVHGPLGTYVPLVREGDEAFSGVARSAPMRAPGNQHNGFATGAGAAYSTDPQAIARSIAMSTRGNNRAALVHTLQEEGLIRAATAADNPKNLTVSYGGRDYPGVLESAKFPVQIIADGKSIWKPGQQVVMPKWLSDELKPIIDRDFKSRPRWLARGDATGMPGLNDLATMGVAEPIFHAHNLQGIVTSHLPVIGEGAGNAILNNAITKGAKTLHEAFSIDLEAPEALSDLHEMSKMGLVPTQTGRAMLGETKPLGGVKGLVFGDKGLDIRARLTMYRYAKEFTSDPQTIYQFVSSLGTYTHGLDSAFERMLKGTGLNPFATAAKTKMIGGVKTILGTTPLPQTGAAAVKARIAQQLTGGSVGVVGTWMVVNKAVTGKWPWEDKNSRLLEIPIGGSRYISLGWGNPVAASGARTLGATDAYKVHQAGGKLDQVLEAAATGAVNSAAGMLTNGPVVRDAFHLAGVEPHLSGFRDDQGKPGIGLLPFAPKAGRHQSQGLLNIGHTLADLNGLELKGLELTGIVSKPDWKAKREKNESKIEQLARAIGETIFPSLLQEHGSNAGLSNYLHRQESSGGGGLPQMKLPGASMPKMPALPKFKGGP